MPMFTHRYATLTVLLAATLALTGCQARDRAGGSADVATTDLRFAVTGDPGTQITAWAGEVDQLSKGTLTISFVRDEHAGQPDYETRMIADVQTGHVDLAWVGARAFDQVGLTTFQPLLAPTVIDSLELEGKVFDAGIPQQMLPSLDRIHLVGVGILPGPIRKLLGVHRPFTTPKDFAGQVVGVQASAVAEQTFRTLGATPKAVPPAVKLAGLDGYDQQLSSIQGNHYDLQGARYVTGNLNLWPRPLVIIANPGRYQHLTDDQRAILGIAATDTIPAAIDAERSGDANATAALCKAGITFTQASDTDLAALTKALAPVYRTINDDPTNKAAAEQITEVKNALHRAPDTAQCTNSPSQTTTSSRYDGTYRRTTNWDKVKPCPDDVSPPAGVGVDEIILDHGSLQLWNWKEGHEEEREQGWDGSYTFFMGQMLITDSSARLTVDFTFDGKTLELSNMRGGACGDIRAWTTGIWTRQ